MTGNVQSLFPGMHFDPSVSMLESLRCVYIGRGFMIHGRGKGPSALVQ